MIYDINDVYYYIAIDCPIPERVIMILKSRGKFIPNFYSNNTGDDYNGDE